MESLFTTVSNLITDPITPITIMSTSIQLMQFVEKVQGLTGVARKQLILDVLAEKVTSPELAFFVTSILPDIIDSIIAFDRGELKIAIVKKCKGLCS
jgi:hypothetical protein